jgi:hypothetical protein
MLGARLAWRAHSVQWGGSWFADDELVELYSAQSQYTATYFMKNEQIVVGVSGCSLQWSIRKINVS